MILSTSDLLSYFIALIGIKYIYIPPSITEVYILQICRPRGGGGKIFVPLAKKWGRIFVPGDFYGNIDKIKDYFIILLNF